MADYRAHIGRGARAESRIGAPTRSDAASATTRSAPASREAARRELLSYTRYREQSEHLLSLPWLDDESDESFVEISSMLIAAMRDSDRSWVGFRSLLADVSEFVEDIAGCPLPTDPPLVLVTIPDEEMERCFDGGDAPEGMLIGRFIVTRERGLEWRVIAHEALHAFQDHPRTTTELALLEGATEAAVEWHLLQDDSRFCPPDMPPNVLPETGYGALSYMVRAVAVATQDHPEEWLRRLVTCRDPAQRLAEFVAAVGCDVDELDHALDRSAGGMLEEPLADGVYDTWDEMTGMPRCVADALARQRGSVERLYHAGYRLVVDPNV